MRSLAETLDIELPTVDPTLTAPAFTGPSTARTSPRAARETGHATRTA
ncbi:hypothetical protein ACGFYZ_27730 [Streptomyces sp. NPDC048330]